VLSNHMAAVLIPGRCLSSGCGAWLSTSATPTISWQSKNFISQYVAEAVLGITNTTVNGSVDQIHASLQIQDAPLQGFCDALNGTGSFQYGGGPHYPRGITSALWWLNARNNPPNPVATSAPDIPGLTRALAGDGRVLLLWQGVSLVSGYNIKRGTISGGPYVPVTNGLAGASFTDSNLDNGTTYYYVLTATNQFGESPPSAEMSATPVPAAGATISAVVSAHGLTISWPPAYVGWILQTNTVGLGTANAWGDVFQSLTRSNMDFPASFFGSKAESFRLRHP